MILCSAAIFGLGAYAAAVSSVRVGASVDVAVFLAIAAGAAGGLVTGLVSLLFSVGPAALSTIGVQLVFTTSVKDWEGLTGGPSGIGGIHQGALLGLSLASTRTRAAYSVLLAGLTVMIVRMISRGLIGVKARAGRDDPFLTASFGIDRRVVNLAIWTISGALCGLAGAMYAFHMQYVEPDSFGLEFSTLLFAVTAFEGRRLRLGVLLGAAAFLVLPEMLRWVGSRYESAAHLRQLMLASGLVGVVMFRAASLARESKVVGVEST